MIGSNTDFGARLKAERERLELNQSEFGKLHGVSRNSQSAYETGGTPAPLDYLRSLESAGVDLGYLLWGVRGGLTLSSAQLALLACYDDAGVRERDALLTVAHSVARRPLPAASITLPSTEALEDAMLGLLDVRQDYAPAELVHEIATQLPIILEAAAHEIPVPASDQRDTGPALQEASGAERASVRPGKRT